LGNGKEAEVIEVLTAQVCRGEWKRVDEWVDWKEEMEWGYSAPQSIVAITTC
jgi:hypothetical protein